MAARDEVPIVPNHMAQRQRAFLLFPIKCDEIGVLRL